MYLHSENPPVSAISWVEGASLLLSSRGSASRFFYAHVFVIQHLSLLLLLLLLLFSSSFLSSLKKNAPMPSLISNQTVTESLKCLFLQILLVFSPVTLTFIHVSSCPSCPSSLSRVLQRQQDMPIHFIPFLFFLIRISLPFFFNLQKSHFTLTPLIAYQL